MDYLVIVVDRKVLTAGETAPAGWYSRRSNWNGEEWISTFELESTDPEARDLPEFTYWEPETVV